ncbi:MAG: hypothetical protein AB1696_27080 [Planctomycetota bacterium]
MAEEELSKAVDEMRQLIQKTKSGKGDRQIKIEQTGDDRFRLSVEQGIARLSMDLVSLKQLEREANEQSNNVLFISAASEQLRKDAEELIVQAMEVVSLAGEYGSQEGWPTS